MMAIRILSIARWILVSLLLLVLAAPAIMSFIRGSSLVEVDGMSMSPAYVTGDVVIVSPPETRPEIRVGDVVTVVDANGSYVTHRVSEVLADGSLQLRGDANNTPDLDPVARESVLGVVDLHLGQPLAGWVLKLQDWPMRLFIVLAVVGLALLPLHRSRRVRTQTEVASRPSESLVV